MSNDDVLFRFRSEMTNYSSRMSRRFQPGTAESLAVANAAVPPRTLDPRPSTLDQASLGEQARQLRC
jgi:hypothetical protein